MSRDLIIWVLPGHLGDVERVHLTQSLAWHQGVLLLAISAALSCTVSFG